jgi:hypothetical protein
VSKISNYLKKRNYKLALFLPNININMHFQNHLSKTMYIYARVSKISIYYEGFKK